jgi:hypothetical protein
MGISQQVTVRVSPTLYNNLNRLIPLPASQIVPDLATRYLNAAGVEKAQAFMNSQVSLATKYLGSIQASVAPLIEWAKSPKARCELFMYKRSRIGEKFSKLIASPLEFLVVIQERIRLFFASKFPVSSYRPTGRAQIMSIRGLALSCAPNHTRISDINLSSRSFSGIA